MPNIRRAQMFESEILTSIAIKSEAYWGYDAIFMESFKSLYRVTEDFINDNPTYLLEDSGTIIGFYGVVLGDRETSLEFMYIDPPFIGKGYGKILWEHMVNACKNFGVNEIVLVTSPQAKGFYTKMGARYLGDVDSLVVKNRRIPKLLFALE